ncbi:MAG: transglycosylase SLT domain-containing protein [Desulfobacterales bacterium]|nr:transglycosylase SLT domain-containing protein [Desulfobacterales bacterium]
MRALLFSSRLTVLLLALTFLMVAPPSSAFPAQEGAYLVFHNFPLPESLTLWGEPMPLENSRVWEMLDREFTISVWDRAQVFMWLKRSGRYFPYVERRLAEEGMPEDLKYLAVAESSLLTHARSSDGARGPWQLMTRTARSNGIRKDHTMDERLDFEQATEVAIKYLKRLKDKFGTWTLALAAYNCGEGALKREMKKQGVTDYYRLNLPLETERFIFRIAAIKIVMDNPMRYGYSLPKEEIYRPIECDTVSVNIRVPLHITDIAQALGTDFKVLRELNHKIPGYYLPTGSYTIKVPSGQGSKMADVLNDLTKVASRRMQDDSYYVVRRGDTLNRIARRKKVNVATLKRLNSIQGSLIMVGQRLRLTP